MIRGTRALPVASVTGLALGITIAPAAQADVFSLLPGSCGDQPESQPFAQFGDYSDYTLVPGGSFEAVSCTSIYHPTVRLFLRNTGSVNSRLLVQALYPGLLGWVQTSTLGELSGTSSWQPSPALQLLGTNLMATLSLDQTAIGFRFTPADGGSWSVDDVYLDPFARG